MESDLVKQISLHYDLSENRQTKLSIIFLFLL